MLDALKQLIGIAPRDNREVWREKPLVIIDAAEIMIFSGLANIEYTPSTSEYEKGHVSIYRASDGALVMNAEIVRQRVYSSFDQSNPWRLRWARNGLTAKAIDAEGRDFTLFVGRHAYTYFLRKTGSPLDITADTVTGPFAEDLDENGEPV